MATKGFDQLRDPVQEWTTMCSGCAANRHGTGKALEVCALSVLGSGIYFVDLERRSNLYLAPWSTFTLPDH